MFGLFKKKPAPEGPVEYVLEILIERPAAQVYRHLDWADPLHTMREQGERVETVDAAQGIHHLQLAGLPDHIFEFTVTDADPHTRYVFVAETRPMIGKLVWMQSDYTLTPQDGDLACMVEMKGSVEFAAGLSLSEYQEEVGRMALASYNSLARLKIHAERGADAAKHAPVDANGCVLLDA